jgi:phosphoglycerol transferase MdoB-like AlkP superfamily enzyme
LAVPSWGANTARTEFAVLSGLSGAALGFDRFNPYHGFAKAPVDSLAWRLKAAGYRTFCVHPFDRTFYGRHRIMPALGFEHFFGDESFGGAERVGFFVSDRAVALFCAELLADHRNIPVFLFAITMENHGPWQAASPMAGIRARNDPLRGLPNDGELRRYLQSLGDADAMIALLTDTLARDGRSGLLGFYGDHLPSLPATFDRLGFSETATDYVLWRPGAPLPRQVDLAAHELSGAILAALHEPAEIVEAPWRERARVQ